MNEIAVLLTCFNRQDKTLACLSRLLALDADLDVYLVDDGSTDGTSSAVREMFPQVNLISGDGNLFWSRGMHLAWEHAATKSYKYFVWLNDDILLYKICFDELFECSHLQADRAVIVGIIESADGGKVLYGGTDSDGQLLRANGQMQPIMNMNGNVVLVPAGVHEILGNLDPVYHHDLGDIDYGYRAASRGIPVMSTRLTVARGEENDFCRVRLWGKGVKARMKRLYSPLGSHPRINFYFRRAHKGVLNAVSYYVFLHLINVLPDGAVRLIFGRRYG